MRAHGVDRSIVLTIARKQIQDSSRDRWLWVYAAAFAGLAAALSVLAPEGATPGAVGRKVLSLIALAQLVIPLMGLTIGVRMLAGERERGTLRFLLAHPVGRAEAFLGILSGATVALGVAVAVGFGTAGVLASVMGMGASAMFVPAAGLAWLLCTAMLAVGMCIGAVVRSAGTAYGIAVLVWVLIGFVGDLGLMGTAAATEMGPMAMLVVAFANPVEAFRIASTQGINGSLDVLGPVGIYAAERFGGALRWLAVVVLAMWTVAASAVGGLAFVRRTDV